MTYQIFKDQSNQWRWRLLANNGRSIAVSGESYFNKADCISAINLVKGSGSAPLQEI